MKKIIISILIILLSNSITIADETKETENVKTGCWPQTKESDLAAAAAADTCIFPYIEKG